MTAPGPRRQALVDDFATWFARLDEVARDRGGAGRFSERWDVVRRSGILRLPFERRHGGLGEDLLTTMAVLERLGYDCRDGGLAFAVCTHMVSAGVPVQRFGSAALKDRYLRRLCDGTAIGAHAITEPEAGSDALAMQTRAVDRGDHYVLTGHKSFVTNGPVADVLVVYARTKPEGGTFGFTAFVVDRDTPGLRTGEPIATMGLVGSAVSEVVLDGCEVPAANVVGRPGAGFLVLDHVLKTEILCTFVASVGAMQRRLERCIAHARERRQFGKPIGAHQAVSHKVVDMHIAVETARRWLYDAAASFASGDQATADVAIAKLVVSEANVQAALAAVQIFGGAGYTKACGVEADLRDAVGGTIYSGTSEIQRNRIARMLGLGDEPSGAGASAAPAAGSSTVTT